MKKTFARVAALGAAALGLTAVGAVAQADTFGPGNIDPAEDGSIIVHKYETPDPWAEDTNHLGAEIPVPEDWVPVEGVTFEVKQVLTVGGEPVDLTTAAGWNVLEDLTAPVDDATFGDPKKVATEENGTASFADLPVGLYQVTEVSKPANVSSTVAPFLVTVPTPVISQDDGTPYWNYDVNVYPKNSLITVNKTVEDLDQKALGDSIVWTVNGSVPVIGKDENHSKYEMVDTLPTEVTYDSSVVKFDGTEQAAGMYTVSDAGSNPVTMSLTADGLAALKSGKVKEVTWELTTTVNALAEGGILKNNVTLQVNDSGKIPNEAEQKWGGIQILKVAKDGPGDDRTLAGAEFQLFKTQDDAASKTSPIEVDGVTTFVTGADGTVVIPGVQVGTYWLAETKAPAGYILNSTPIQVEVTAGDLADFVKVKVENEQKPAFDLPATGAAGLALMILLGGGLLALGVVAVRKSAASRKQGTVA